MEELGQLSFKFPFPRFNAFGYLRSEAVKMARQTYSSTVQKPMEKELPRDPMEVSSKTLTFSLVLKHHSTRKSYPVVLKADSIKYTDWQKTTSLMIGSQETDPAVTRMTARQTGV